MSAQQKAEILQQTIQVHIDITIKDKISLENFILMNRTLVTCEHHILIPSKSCDSNKVSQIFHMTRTLQGEF